MGFNECCAYLHSRIEKSTDLSLKLYYDEHYCNYFKKKPSKWTLELSDNYSERITSVRLRFVQRCLIYLYTAHYSVLKILRLEILISLI